MSQNVKNPRPTTNIPHYKNLFELMFLEGNHCILIQIALNYVHNFAADPGLIFASPESGVKPYLNNWRKKQLKHVYVNEIQIFIVIKTLQYCLNYYFVR